jgi:phosphate transport system permease protein
VSFTGHARKRVTSKKVRVAERVARSAITIGGIGTIAAVVTICVFLVWVVVPLFRQGSLGAPRQAAMAGAETRPDRKPLKLGVEEYRVLCWTIDDGGRFEVRRLDDGSLVEHRDLVAAPPTSAAFGIGDGRFAFGFSDGSTRAGAIVAGSELVPPEQVPETFRESKPGAVMTREGGVLVRLPSGQVRKQWISAQLQEAVASKAATSVMLLDLSVTPSREILCVLRADDTLVLQEITRTRNLLTDEEKVEVAEAKLPYARRADGAQPSFLKISERGDQVYLAWADGHLLRYDCRDLAAPILAETLDVVPAIGVGLTSLEFMNGRNTLVVGDSAGGVNGWFWTKPPNTANPDGIVMKLAHELPRHAAAVTASATSTRTRLFASADAAGGVRVAQMTTEKIIAEARLSERTPIRCLELAPKNDAVVALAGPRLLSFDLDAAHSEVSLRTILLPVWYENAPGPAFAWQSGGGSDDYEPKLGLWPLIFGTLKATFYSLLFAVPIALLAALYTSEFLHPRVRAAVKPTIEMMASLPSVVLGFIAGLVLAPFVETVIPAVLLAFIAIPLTCVIGAYFWQLLPQPVAARLSGWPRFAVMACLLPLGILAAKKLGPVFERVFFAGDVKLWLDGQIPGTTGVWTLLLLPVSGIAVGILFSRVVNPRLLARSVGWTHGRSAAADFAKFLAGAALAALLAWAVGALLDAAGVDPRGAFLGTFVQRNALIVGFVMGFAVIPIIYTLAEDALSSVPVHLRSASLGCGATRWQTATRIVLPTALSGIFSAIMVGLGRGVGETMIILMATGNTAVLDWNVFNGFRTLSANIAVELPEAVHGSTHYRTLFLAALMLFLITFVFNTIAELVRMRFRKRAYQL